MSGDVGIPILAETALEDRIQREEPVVVLFYADWCGYSRAFLPTFKQRSGELPSPAVAANLSHPEDPRWEDYGIEAIPTLVAFRAGEEIARADAQPGVGLDGEDLTRFVGELSA